MPFVMALDQGTSSSRAIVFDERGRVRGEAQREFPQIFPRPGWVEHDPEQIWSSQIQVAGEALDNAGLGAGDLAAVGITNQRETTLLWDRRSGEPVHNAIVWQDRRTAARCDELRAAGSEEMVRERTGLLIDAYFSATKIAWLLEHVPEARERAEAGHLAFGTVDSWLVHRLTAGRLHLTDPSNACRTLLYDLERLEWDDDLLALFGVPRAVLPRVVSSSEVVGEVEVEPLRGVPLAGIVGDQQAALFGQGCHSRGQAKNTYGTGCFLLMNTAGAPIRSRNQLLSSVAWTTRAGTEFALEGAVFMGGAVVQWLRDGLGIVESAADIEGLARSVAGSEGVVLVPAFTGLGAPHWDPHAEGAVVGLTRGVTRAHIARAALEGIAFQVVDLVRAMQDDAGFPLDELRVDGGAARNDLLLQIQADLLQAPVVRSTRAESTAWGAAGVAGLAVGVWPDLPAIASLAEVDRRFDPEISADEALARHQRWQRAVAGVRAYAEEPGA